MSTSITMETSYSGKESTRSITNVNPNASDADIATFTKGLNALTDNTLKKVNRVDKTEIDTDITYYDITISKDASQSSGSHIVWNESEPTKITITQGITDHEYLTLILKVNNNVLNLENGVPYIVERHATSNNGTNPFSIAVGSDAITFDMLNAGIDGYVTVKIPGGKTLIGSPTREYYFNGVTFTIEGASA